MKYVKIGAIATAIGFVFFLIYMVFGSYSDGVRSGQLYKFSEKGFLLKTYEGELNLGGTDNVTMSPIKWEFSVNSNDKELIDQLYKAIGQPVSLKYREKYFTLFWRGDTKYFVYSVEIDSNKSKNKLNK